MLRASLVSCVCKPAQVCVSIKMFFSSTNHQSSCQHDQIRTRGLEWVKEGGTIRWVWSGGDGAHCSPEDLHTHTHTYAQIYFLTKASPFNTILRTAVAQAHKKTHRHTFPHAFNKLFYTLTHSHTLTQVLLPL